MNGCQPNESASESRRVTSLCRCSAAFAFPHATRPRRYAATLLRGYAAMRLRGYAVTRPRGYVATRLRGYIESLFVF